MKNQNPKPVSTPGFDTNVELTVSPLAFEEIKSILKKAGYENLFEDEGRLIDMRGLHLRLGCPEEKLKDSVPLVLYFPRREDADEFVRMAGMEPQVDIKHSDLGGFVMRFKR